MNRRTIVVGDIHGCFEALMELMSRVSFAPGVDDLILVGDLVDRGPKSGEVVRWAMKVGARMTLGNHEEKHLRYMRHEKIRDQDPTYTNPMTMSDYQVDAYFQMSNREREWLARAPLFIRVSHLNLVVVHGGLLPGKAPEEHHKSQIIYTRFVNESSGKQVQHTKDFTAPPGSLHWSLLWDGPENVAFGHQVMSMERPYVCTSKGGARCFGLDTGACFGGLLTAAVWEPGEDPDFPEFFSMEVDAVYGMTNASW